MASNQSTPTLRCGFCNRLASELGDAKLINGHQNAAICSSCIQTCNTLLHENEQAKSAKSVPVFKNLFPPDVKKYLDEFVIEQESAKITISVAVCDHYKRIKSNNEKSRKGIKLDKSNILMVGPTGTGKTQFARAIADFLGVPFAIGDATSLTEAGYVGDDVENLLLRLIQAADGDVSLAQNGILFLDEVDKIASTKSSRSTSKDVGGEGVQQALLKMLEGTVSHVPLKGGRKHPESSVVAFDTSNVLFICSGAFVGLEDIIAERKEAHSSMGFNVADEQKEVKKIHKDLEPEDFVRYGLIPEFVGRLPVVAQLHALDKKALKRIFTEIRNNLLDQFTLQFKLDGVTLKLTDKAIDEIIDEAVVLGTGARGLRAIAERMIQPYKYRIGDYVKDGECIIDGHLIQGAFGEDKDSALVG